MNRILLVWCVVLLTACGGSSETSDENDIPDPIETPPSYLSFRVYFPANELQQGINRVLPTTILHRSFPMEKNGDSIHLHIKRAGNIIFDIRELTAYASIPLELNAGITKRILGVSFSNKDSPLNFSGYLKASAAIELDEDWNMIFTCSYLGFEWKEKPRLNVLGIGLDLREPIESALEARKDEISDQICRGLNQSFDFRSIVEKVWLDLQKAQRIAKEPEKVWIYSLPNALNGQLIPFKQDTLCVHIEYRTQVEISPVLKPVINPVALVKRENPIHIQSTLLAYPSVVLPLDYLERNLKREFVNQEFAYEGYSFQVIDLHVARKAQLLEVTLDTEGDISGQLIIQGKPGLNDEKQLVLESFSLEINAREEWIKMAGWAVHKVVENYISDQIRMDVNPLLTQLGEVIETGIDKSRVGDKIRLGIQFDNISSYKQRLTNEQFQWIFYTEGSARIDLKDGVFKKKLN